MKFERQTLKSLLAVRFFIPKIHILFTLFAIVFGFVIGSMINLATTLDSLSLLSISAILAIGIYMLLYQVNNYLYANAEKTIHSIINNPRDQYFEAQMNFISKINSLKSNPDPEFAEREIEDLFLTIFKGQKREAYAVFLIYRGEMYRFMLNLSEADREMIFRYYINNE